ncbi:molybdate ABC transporter substrate-binding protein [Marinobacter salicampi]|uniref:molybdate ABC transporter substrate-binding protein n=1 Tax=Marinobacter salicampi TaxID=435907 RepID=UPI001F5EF788|nr:molybdate ABC transporter substrate-binding protein [Marinobacter salicampi]
MTALTGTQPWLMVMLLVVALQAAPARAAEALVAVASNFSATAEALAQRFEAQTGHTITFSFGSTGKLYAQIAHGAPFDAFLAADEERPARAEAEGHALPGSRFTYAEGKLVLWSPVAGRFEEGEAWLMQQDFRRLAIANPKTAPYGRAARDLLEQLGIIDQVQKRLVRGESIAQAFQFAATRNTDAGLVALAQLSDEDTQNGSYWPVPEHYYEPIYQQAVLLMRGQDNEAARDWLEFLQQPEALELIEQHGYGTVTTP